MGTTTTFVKKATSVTTQATNQTNPTCMNWITDLVRRTEDWEENEYAGSNKTLYAIIGDVVGLHYSMTEGDQALDFKNALNSLIEQKGYKFRNDTPLTQKITRCIFGDRDRRRISTYNKVVVYAIANNWNAKDVAEKISSAGGIHMISVRKPASVIPQDNAEKAIKKIKASCIGTLTSEIIKSSMRNDRHGDLALAVITQMPNGSYSVNCIVNHGKLAVDAMTAYYKANKKAFDKEFEVEAKSKEAATQNQLIDDAASSVKLAA